MARSEILAKSTCCQPVAVSLVKGAVAEAGQQIDAPAARLVADLMAGRPSALDLAPFRPQRFM